MGKPCYDHYPRSIVQSRHDHPATLIVTIPKKIVQAMQLEQGELVEFVTVTEGESSYLKLSNVQVEHQSVTMTWRSWKLISTLLDG